MRWLPPLHWHCRLAVKAETRRRAGSLRVGKPRARRRRRNRPSANRRIDRRVAGAFGIAAYRRCPRPSRRHHPKRLFQEGSYVRAGQPLYQIDSSTYEAGLESARAQLATAQATLAKADADLARYKPLVSADAISKQEYDAAVTAKRSAEAGVKAAQAAIKSAGINLNRSRITAPISGFIGQSKVSEGTLLNAGDTTVLATIRQTNPMYVNVTQSASEVMKLRRQIAEGKLLAADGAIAVGIKFDDGTVYPEKAACCLLIRPLTNRPVRLPCAPPYRTIRIS